LSVTDANHDGTLDLIALRAGGAIQRLSLRPDGRWETAELARWSQAPAGGMVQLLWADLDNNGAQDLVVTSGQGSQVWLADGQGRVPRGGRRALRLAERLLARRIRADGG